MTLLSAAIRKRLTQLVYFSLVEFLASLDRLKLFVLFLFLLLCLLSGYLGNLNELLHVDAHVLDFLVKLLHFVLPFHENSLIVCYDLVFRGKFVV